MKKIEFKKYLFLLAAIFIFAAAATAQTTAFNYQGRLTDAGTPQTTYQMQFKLFDATTGGTPIGGTIENASVAVNQGVFSILLDFGANVFTGADRFLEIAVRRSASESYTTLSPRQQIASSPYSVRTLSAAQADVALDANRLGGVAASEYVTNSSLGNSFVRNQTTQQANSNFNISGSGIVGGNLGIGTQSPLTRLHAVGTSWFQGDNTPLPASAGKGIGIGFSGEAGYLFAFDYGTFTPRTLLLNSPGGNIAQGLSGYGIPKAMLVVAENATIVRCYNGVTGVSTGNCGFAVTRPLTGGYSINLGFPTNNRFAVATPSFGGAQTAFHIRISYAADAIEVLTDNTQNQQLNSNFTVIVF